MHLPQRRARPSQPGEESAERWEEALGHFGAKRAQLLAALTVSRRRKRVFKDHRAQIRHNREDACERLWQVDES